MPKPDALRRTFATWALAAGFDTFELSRLMGTSLNMLDRHYGQLARGYDERASERLNQRPSLAGNKAAQAGAR